MTRPGESEASLMDRDDLRIGDAEREQTMAALREHFAQGRLTHEELDERLEQTLSARTGRDLAKITADLPGHGPATATRGPGHEFASWQEAMKAHKMQMRLYHQQMRPHMHRPKLPRHHGHRGPGPIVPILFVFLMIALFTGGFGVLKFLFFLWLGAMLFMFVSRKFNSRR